MSMVAVKNALVAVVQNAQYAAHSAFVQVLDYPTDNFTGLPSAVVRPEPSSSVYATLAINERTYGFAVDILISLDENQDTWSTTYGTMYGIVEDVCNRIDQSLDLSATCDFVGATTISAFEPVQTGLGLALLATVGVTASVSITVQ